MAREQEILNGFHHTRTTISHASTTTMKHLPRKNRTDIHHTHGIQKTQNATHANKQQYAATATTEDTKKNEATPATQHAEGAEAYGGGGGYPQSSDISKQINLSLIQRFHIVLVHRINTYRSLSTPA